MLSVILVNKIQCTPALSYYLLEVYRQNQTVKEINLPNPTDKTCSFDEEAKKLFRIRNSNSDV